MYHQKSPNTDETHTALKTSKTSNAHAYTHSPATYLLIQQRLSLGQLRQPRLELVERVFAALEVNGEAVRTDKALLLFQRHVGRL